MAAGQGAIGSGGGNTQSAGRRGALRRLPLVRLFGGGEGKWTRADAIAVLAVGATILTTVGTAVIALGTNRIAEANNDIAAESLQVDKSAQVMRDDLRVALAEARLGEPITAREVDADKEEPTTTRPALIDLTLRNSGNSPALIDQVQVEFEEVDPIDTCGYVAGGPVEILATFDFTLKYGDDTSVPRTKPAHYKVPSNDIERIAVTVGPESTPEASGVWVAVVKVSLKIAGTEGLLDAGTYAVMTAPAGGWVQMRGESWEFAEEATLNQKICIDEEREHVRGLVGRPGVKPSAELVQLDQALAGYAPTPVANDGNDYPQYVAGTCITDLGENFGEAGCEPGTYEIQRRIPFTVDAAKCVGASRPVETGNFTKDFVLCLKER